MQRLPLLRNRLSALSLLAVLLCACGDLQATSKAGRETMAQAAPPAAAPSPLQSSELPLTAERLAAIDCLVPQEIAAGRLPGAVVLVGQGERVVYRRAFGQRSLKSSAVQSTPQAMTTDTIFDLASLTKVVVTTTAVMQLIERRILALDTPAAHYWPAFGNHDKSTITIRHLLAHTSGLPAGLETSDLLKKEPGKRMDVARQRLALAKPQQPPGREVQYSDLNFAILGELVERTTGLPLNVYAEHNIFKPLKMNDSGYLPRRELRPRIAPSSMPAGRVHDPLARCLEGVAGNAGAFAAADDLALFAAALLNGGAPILSAASVSEMLSPQTPPGQSPAGPFRGLGWRLDPVLASNRAALPPLGAASHLGYTGTGLWLDPVRKVFVIVLSNRLHPGDGGDAGPLRAKIVAAVSEALGPLPAQAIGQARPELAERVAPYLIKAAEPPVAAGIDVLAAQAFAPLQGKRVGLLTHRSAVDAHGRRTIDVLSRAPGISLSHLFSPEHGLSADQEGKIKDDHDLLSGLPITSLYGDSRRPTAAMLAGLDVLVVDLQDVGARFYTYASSVAYLLEAAAPLHIPVYVLDRPNPIGADLVQGPLLDKERRSFTGYWPLPVRHGMTIGELAALFAGEAAIPVDLHVIPMQNFHRASYMDGSGRPWIPPSPNLVRLESAILYPGVGMIEGARISVGRGTSTPFELVGAPWIDKDKFSAELHKVGLAGVTFRPTEFSPSAGPYAGKTCQGVALTVSNRQELDSPALGIALAAILHRLHPSQFSLNETLGGVGAKASLDDIRNGLPVPEIIGRWNAPLHDFAKVREKYLLYH